MDPQPPQTPEQEPSPSSPPGAPTSPAPAPPPAPSPYLPPSPPPPFAGEAHRGTLILVLGILSIVLTLSFWCSPVGLGLGIAAWCMGRKDLQKMNLGVMDPSGRQLTTAGNICGIVGTLLGVAMFLLGVVYLVFMAVIFAATAAGS